MNPYQEFKKNIDNVLDDIDTLCFALDNRAMYPYRTVSELMTAYKSAADKLNQAIEDLIKEEGDTPVKDIDYEGTFRN